MDFQILIMYPKRACFLQKTAKNGLIIFSVCCSQLVGTKKGKWEELEEIEAIKMPTRQVSACVGSYTVGSLPGGLDDQSFARYFD